jgi:hypothetical protein
MSQIKAIETFYKGYHFRSRLEARWAVFFDALGISWKYEVEGYEKEVGATTVTGEEVTEIMRYLPDFFLPNSRGGGGVYVEVKGDKNALKNNWEHHAQMHDWGGVLPGFHDSKGQSNAGLLLLSDIPEASESKIYFHPILQHDQGLVKSFAFFAGNRLSVIENSPLAEILSIDPIYGLDCSGQNWDIEMRQVHTNRYYTNVVKAYAAARAARFEHGQQGIT